MSSRLCCQGCGRELPADDPAPFRCPAAGTDGGDHVVGRTLEPSPGVRFPHEGSTNPFVRYRALTFAHALATARGMHDEAFVDLVQELDHAVTRVQGHGFVMTPFARSPELSAAIGLAEPSGVWVKDETGNVGGSHKGRHLMGLAILGEVRARLGLAPAGSPRLAIASCGNAALAAAVIARAWEKPLDVFIPGDANPRVVAELERLGASIHVCRRHEGVAGDPCYHAFREAVAGGAVPFCCQGSDNGLTIEGGETLGWEMIGEMVRNERPLDRLFVQVGGGALASACVQAFRDAARVGAPIRAPRLHAVQTRGGFPLRRAWERVTSRVLLRLGMSAAGSDGDIAERIRAHAGSPEVETEIAYAAAHRAEFMWPWETEPKSVAHGILDDETYDWLAIVRGMLESGGFPVVVGEARLMEANELGRAGTGIDVDPTGSSGLAGLLEIHEQIGPDEAVGVIFSGVRR